MSETPEWEELARRYVDLWQDYVSALASDPALAEQFARSVAAAWSVNPAMMFGALTWPPGAPRDGTTTGTAAAAAAPGGGDGDMARLSQRLGDIERRLDALESRKGNTTRPAKRRQSVGKA